MMTHSSTSKNRTHWLTTALRPGTPGDVRGAALQTIRSAIRIARGQMTDTARILGVNPGTLYRLIARAPELADAVESAREIRLRETLCDGRQSTKPGMPSSPASTPGA